jgi:hypothetical protein
MAENIRLWTYHEPAFPLTDPNLEIDPTKGTNWADLRYRRVLHRFQQLVGTEQFLWCHTKDGLGVRFHADNDPVLKWVLEVPITHVLQFYRESQWLDIYESRTDVWEGLILGNDPSVTGDDIGACVKVPIPSDFVVDTEELKPIYPRKRDKS